MKKLWAMALIAGCALPSIAQTEKSVQKADPAKGQQIATQVCAACHGADGNSAGPTNPNLAGQHPQYITKQLLNFKAGDRKNPIMQGMAAPLSADDIRNLAAYYAAQTPKPAPARDKLLAMQGERIYRGGIAATSVPACSGCHAPDGSGIPAMFPRLAGQPADYTLAQLKNFRALERTNDPGNMMERIAARMSDHEMRAVSEYLVGLR